jgi:putative ABC transport system permease protein
VLGGLYLGLLEGNVSYLRTLPGDVVVSEKGAPLVTTLLQSSRIGPAEVRAVRAVPGVAQADALYGRLVSVSRGPAFTLVYLVGRRWSETFAGPVALRAGRRRPHIGEIVVDRVLAHDLGQGIGGEVVVGEAHLRIVGIADGGNAVLGTYAFVHRGALVLAGVTDPAYLFVHAAPGTDPDDLARRIDALPGVRAVTRARFLVEKQAPFRQMLLPVIALVVGLAAAAGAVVVGVVLFTATLERRLEHAILRAVGLTRRRLRAMALAESGIASAFGIGAGLAGGRLVAAGLGAAEPRFLTETPAWLALAVALGAGGLTFVATLLPLRALGRLEPAPVLRA